MTAKDIMTTPVISVTENTSIHEVAKLMAELGISGLVVTNAEEEMIGIITERDVMVAFEFLHETKGSIHDYIQRDVVTVREETTVDDVSRILIEKNIRRVPVLKDKVAVGIISRRDIIRYFYKKNFR